MNKQIFRAVVAMLAGSMALTVSHLTSAEALLAGDSNGVSVLKTPENALSIEVAGPGGFKLETEEFYIDSDVGLADGQYRYQIIGELERDLSQVISGGDDGRRLGAVPTNAPIGVLETGVFWLQDGEILRDISE